MSPDPGPAAPDPGSGASTRKHNRPLWRDLVLIVIAALAVTVVLKAFVIQVYSVPSGSMKDTLLPGDRILVNRLVYRFRPIARGDIVVFNGSGSWNRVTRLPGNPVLRFWDDLASVAGFKTEGTDYVKRVIGVPGDRVKCCDALGRVTVNGVPLNETSYIASGDAPSQVPFSITVPPGRLWVMGDNRADSDDSRFRSESPGKGTIPESAVVGRASLIVWPLSQVTDLPIPQTFSQPGLRAASVSGAPAALAPATPAAPRSATPPPPTAPPSTAPAAPAGVAAVVMTGALAWRRRRR